MMESISSDEELILLSAASAAVIVMRRRRRRRLKHQRKLWSKPWLLERDGVRGISNFVRYELSDDTSGFFGFLRMSPLVPGAAAISPPPPVIFSQVAASRFRGAPPPPPVIFASRRPRHIFWRTIIFTNGSDEICHLAHFYIAITIL
jgi:hypothetical protein